MGTVVRLDSRTRLVLPASIRRELNLKSGDSMWVEATADGRLEIAPLASKVSAAKGLFESYKGPEEKVVDEFIKERRDEASTEE